ncbi:isochorismatase family protein [Halomonas sp. 18H]|uniref:isochorismatase family protein n=1 Tax=Halomonas almeriensis TaxID=308163 RepID=UPI002231C886|nr:MULTISPECIES: isochorismatase family protein [Halomonas]MCW4153555.1 isochorismatase family protein [Halomonas sp. 18H]MDN3551907.1 isochorismatase family protein [Halomonas almeriensis]
MRMHSESSLLLMVDIQSRLLPVLEDGGQVIEEAAWMGGVAEALGIPVWLTEQYPQGLGHTVPALVTALTSPRYWQKYHFNAHAEAPFARALAETGRRQVILCGAEAHICVLQTGLALLEAGYEVFWLSEAVGSRRRDEVTLARQRLVEAGARAVSADMVAYEWLERCDGATFKEIHQRFLKARSERPLTFR